MKLATFEQLDQSVQEETLWTNGTLVDERDQTGYKILLYQIYSFYVEVFYNIKLNEITRIRCFSSTSYLKPYLEKIDVQGLLAS